VRDVLSSNSARASGPVLDNGRHVERASELARDETRQCIRAASGRVADLDLDRPGRPMRVVAAAREQRDGPAVIKHATAATEILGISAGP
jgi:hypothetical protein